MRGIVKAFVVSAFMLTCAAVSIGSRAAEEFENVDLDAVSRNALLLIGPVEAVDAKKGTVTVLGQKVFLRGAIRPTVGANVAVFGQLRTDGSIAASIIEPVGVYVAGATPVLVTGIVKAVDLRLARITVGNVQVDYSPSTAVVPATELVVGDIVQFIGSQPAAKGLVLAEHVGIVTADGIIGGGYKLDGIIGGGQSFTTGIIGGGKALLDGIIGGGKASLDGIIGGGKSATQGIIGGGKASTLGIIGGGKVSTTGIIGGGKVSTNGIIGGGK